MPAHTPQHLATHGTEEEMSLAQVHGVSSAPCDRATALNGLTFPRNTAPPLYIDLALGETWLLLLHRESISMEKPALELFMNVTFVKRDEGVSAFRVTGLGGALLGCIFLSSVFFSPCIHCLHQHSR